MILVTPELYRDIKQRLKLYNDAKNKLFHKEHTFTPTMIRQILQEAGLPSIVTNKEKDALEFYEFIYNPPDDLKAYIDNNQATTWEGSILGSVIVGETVTRDDEPYAKVTLNGVNGVTYYGECHVVHKYATLRRIS